MVAKKKKEAESNQRYVVISHATKAYLQDEVNLMIEKGYKPVGGIYGMIGKDDSGNLITEYSQAMMRPADAYSF